MSPHIQDLDPEIIELIKSNDLIKVNFERETIEFYTPGIEKPITSMSFMTPADLLSQAIRDACK